MTSLQPAPGRLTGADYYLHVAEAVSRRGDCRRRQVGAVIVLWDRIYATGCNGTRTPGAPGCLEGACPRGLKSFEEVPAYTAYDDCIAVHAEVNAIEQFERIAVSWGMRTNFKGWAETLPTRAGLLMYVNHEPCSGCTRRLQHMGMKWMAA